MMDLNLLALHTCEIARAAGAYIRKERKDFSIDKVEKKHAHDYVSYVDKGSECFIVDALKKLLPDAGYITEEGTTLAIQADNDSEGDARMGLVWVVDPLDGTTNFIHGYAPYAVSIALMQGQEILIGVVYEICADECYYAWKDGGAWMNGLPLRVGQNVLNDALICLQLPYNSDAYKPIISKLISHFYGRVGSIRMIGSAAMALCYVAAGRLDAYAERYIGQWDFMAGALIVSEAGGCVTNYNGSSDFTQGDSVIATNKVVHQDLLDAIASGY